MTTHAAKLVFVVPADRLSAARTWVTDNIDPAGVAWFALPLSGTGAAPATYHAACYHATLAELKKWAMTLRSYVSGVSDPSLSWDGWGRAEWFAWFEELRTALRGGAKKYYLRVAWNDLGEAPDAAAEFALGNLKAVAP